MMKYFTRYIGVKNFIFFILAILFVIFIAQIKDIAILFFASFVISCSLNPLVDKLVNAKRMKRSLASTIVLLSLLLIGFLFIIPIIVIGGQQIGSFLELLPEHFNNTKEYLLSVPFLASTDLKSLELGGLISSISGFTSNVVNSSIMFSKGIASFLIYFLAACIIIYYFLTDKDIVKAGYLSLFPKSMKKRANEIVESISQKVGGYVLAQVVTMASVGFIVFIGLVILGVDYAIILGLITAVFDLVPVVGPAIAFVVIILAVSKMSILKIVLVALLFLFAQWAENNLVRPYVFSKLLDLHPLIIYFFLLVTAQYLGIVGVIFAPAIAATACVLLEELYIKSVN